MEARRQARVRWLVPAGEMALCAALIMLVGGCGSASSTARHDSTPASTVYAGPTVPPGGPSIPAPTAPPQVAATATVVTGHTQAGAADVCSQPKSVTTQPPQSVPAYPNAELHVTDSNGGNGFYGYCVGDSVSTVAQWFGQQLPAKGWQQLQNTTIQSVEQISGANGSQRIIVTIAPDALTSGETDITVEVLA